MACAAGRRKRGEEGRGGVCSGETRRETGNRTWLTKTNAQLGVASFLWGNMRAAAWETAPQI